MSDQRILNVIPSSCDTSRLVIAVERGADGDERFVLRQESYADDVGWFVQSVVPIEADQLASIKATLTSTVTSGRPGPVGSRTAAKILPFRRAAAS